MILYFDKKTGTITGTIDGRIHTESQLDMWIGSKEDTDRIIVQWKPIAWYDEKGNAVSHKSPRVFTADFEPESAQKELFEKFEKDEEKLKDYKVDLRTKTLVRK